jgi:hypothetical protein
LKLPRISLLYGIVNPISVRVAETKDGVFRLTGGRHNASRTHEECSDTKAHFEERNGQKNN